MENKYYSAKFMYAFYMHQYTHPKWCPRGITKPQKRKLQCMRNQQKAEHEAEMWRDDLFEAIHPYPSQI